MTRCCIRVMDYSRLLSTCHLYACALSMYVYLKLRLQIQPQLPLDPLLHIQSPFCNYPNQSSPGQREKHTYHLVSTQYVMACRPETIHIVNVHPAPIAPNNGSTAAELPAAKIYCTIYLPDTTSERLWAIASIYTVSNPQKPGETRLASSISIQPIERPHQAEPAEKRSYNWDHHPALFLLQGPSEYQGRHRQHAQ